MSKRKKLKSDAKDDKPDLALIRQLPWPRGFPTLGPSQLCPYTSHASGKQSLWDVINKNLPDEAGVGRDMRQQFLKLLMGVINEAVDPRDKNRVCPSDVPSTSDRRTVAPYSSAEVAAWWNETVVKLNEILRR